VLDDLPVHDVRRFEFGLYDFLSAKYPDVEHQITTSKDLSDDTIKTLNKALSEYKAEFLAKGQTAAA
jgi:F-type H+-transporting ATPase subunit alpha